MDRYERGDEAQRLYTEEGLSLKDIAERLGCSKTTVWRDLQNRNVQMRPTPADYRRQRQAQQAVRRAEKLKAKELRQLVWEEQHSELSLQGVLRLIDSL